MGFSHSKATDQSGSKKEIEEIQLSTPRPAQRTRNTLSHQTIYDLDDLKLMNEQIQTFDVQLNQFQ